MKSACTEVMQLYLQTFTVPGGEQLLLSLLEPYIVVFPPGVTAEDFGTALQGLRDGIVGDRSEFKCNNECMESVYGMRDNPDE